jgi:HAD superfamily hydrolase (TIGR01509 family)
MPEAVLFDLDGVIVDSESAWAEAKHDLVDEAGGSWKPEATRAMLGMSSPEWSRYLRDELGVPLSVEEINAAVVATLERRYRESLPLIPGAVDAVRRIAEGWQLGLASSSNREIIDLVLEHAGLTDAFAVTVSSEEVARGKPAPDVYLEAARRLGADPARCVAIEDSSNGLRSAAGAGTAVVAIPNREFPPAPEGLAAADVVIDSLHDLTPEAVELVAA